MTVLQLRFCLNSVYDHKTQNKIIGVAAPTTLVSAGTFPKVLGNLPAEIIPLYDTTNFTRTSWNLTDPVAYDWNGRIYSRQELIMLICSSLTLLVGLIQLSMGT